MSGVGVGVAVGSASCTAALMVAGISGVGDGAGGEPKIQPPAATATSMAANKSNRLKPAGIGFAIISPEF